MNKVTHAALIVLATFITACNDNEKPNQPPIIEKIQLTTTVSFNELNQPYMPHELIAIASDPDGDTLTYSWRLLTSTNKVDLNNTTSKSLAFDYPMAFSEEQYFLTFELTVTDENNASATTTYENDFNDYLYAQLPIGLTASTNETITISPEVYGRKSEISHYQWQILSDHDLLLVGSDSEEVTITLPSFETSVSMALTLTKIDGNEEVYATEITVTE